MRFLTLSLAFGLGGAYFAQPAMAAINSGKASCTDEFVDKLKKINKEDVTKIDPNTRCAANENTTHNKTIDPTQRPKLKFRRGGEESNTSFEGACHSSYEAVHLVFDKLVESRKETCDKLYTELDENFPNCLGQNPPDTCKQNLDAMVEVYTKSKKQLLGDISDSVKFLDKYVEWNVEAKGKFTADLNQLREIRVSNRAAELLLAPSTPPEVSRSVVATSQGANSLGEYLTKLETRKIGPRATASRVTGAAIVAASPIDEQEDAKKFTAAYIEKLKTLKNQEDSEFTAKLSAFKEGLMKPADKSSLADNVTKYAPAAAPIAGTLLQGAGANTASTIAGSSGALPALAVMGAAGAAGIAMGKKSASGADGSSSLGGIVGPVMTPNIKTEGTEFGGNDNAQAPAPLPNSPLGSNETDKEIKAVESNAAGNNNATTAAAVGGGASVMPGKNKNNREVASASPSTAGEEALNPFAGDLRPSPRPAASTESAGNDVSNLLGKMKDLFNMDDSFGMDNVPPPDLGGGAHAATSSGGGPTGGDEYVGEEYNGGEDAQAESEYAGGGEESYQGSNPMGDIETNLFRRVHARHVKCMEKGLVILLSQELPE